MRRELTEQAEAMARQRVRDLGEELRSAGLLPPESDDEEFPVALVKAPGRHARTRVGLPALPRFAERLSERLSERLPFATPHLTVLVVVAAVVLVVIAWVRISASSEAVPVPQAHTSRPFPTATPSPSSSAAAAGTAEVVVDVAGKVRRPGVQTLPAGSRVIDAIRKAGGAKSGADLTSVNLARVLVDGEQILVGVAPAPGSPSGPAGGPAAAAPGAGGPLSLNQATAAQLESLPGVGPVTAQKIVDWRTEHGAFSSIDELLDVDGIGDKTLAELAPHLSL